MYINPFFAGVVTTIGAELTLLFLAALVMTVRKVKR